MAAHKGQLDFYGSIIPVIDDKIQRKRAPRLQLLPRPKLSCTDTTGPTAVTSSAYPVASSDEAQSTILLGNIVLQAGSVLSKVVKPNIAVKNGVVHLIKKPLMVSEGDVFRMIQVWRRQTTWGLLKLPCINHARWGGSNEMTHGFIECSIELPLVSNTIGRPCGTDSLTRAVIALEHIINEAVPIVHVNTGIYIERAVS